MRTWRTRQKQEPGTQGVPGETGEQREPGNPEELENQKKIIWENRGTRRVRRTNQEKQEN